MSDITPPERRPRSKPKRLEPLAKPAGPPLHEQARAADPTFKTPEEAAADDTPPSPLLPMVIDHSAGGKSTGKELGNSRPSQPPNGKPGRFGWLRRLRPRTRKMKIIYGAAAILLAFGIGAGWTVTHQKRAVVADKPVQHQKPKPKPPETIYSTLSGLPVADESVNQRPVTGIMIENSLDARPQSGLSQAGVVYEAIAEGGITRFLALYQDTSPDDIGPVRSARPYYVQWALGFDAAYAHVGGSPQALSDIRTWGVKDMNQFAYGNYYHRIASRAAPHNVYTSMAKLNELEASRGFTSNLTGWPRATKEAPSATPDARSLDFAISGYLYNPHYDYVPETNSYNRSEAGEAHMDAGTGKQISPKVVIAMVTPLARGERNGSGYYNDYQVIGSGQAYIFQNGTVTIGTWTKSANNSQTTFTDAAGTPIPLNRGQTWISVVSAANQVHYQ